MADDMSLDDNIIALPPEGALTLGDVLSYQFERLRAIRDAPSDDDIRAVLAREHYFKTWDRAMAHANERFDRRFEAAADAVVAGDLAALQGLLAEDPALATARSSYGHRQPLLHHVAQNGIESPRQKSGAPANMPDIARALLAAGADPNTTSQSYGGNDTVLTLLCSSVHPHDAGVQAALVEVLVAGGADVNERDSAPLWTAITWGYAKAADALVRCGALPDNLVLAAGAGDLERTRAFADELDDTPRRDLRIPNTTKVLPARHLLEYALIYAASCNRADVVELLLERGPDLTIREPIYGASAVSIAEHHLAARPEYGPLVELLRARSGG
ncbi:MAG TPA: hypothetical protein VMZ53_15000 [Kofleriaceae bacterium]|nr:hypothetical protein [Kofleriaceae bacterium]